MLLNTCSRNKRRKNCEESRWRSQSALVRPLAMPCLIDAKISLVPKHQLIVPSTLLALAINIRTYKATKIHTFTPLPYEPLFQNSSIKRQGFKIKVVEKAGVAIKKLLQRSDPFKSRKCERGDYPMCREDGKGPFDRQSVTYDIKSTESNDIYIGETSRSAYTRGKEYMKSLAKKEERSALCKHCKEKHNSEM